MERNSELGKIPERVFKDFPATNTLYGWFSPENYEVQRKKASAERVDYLLVHYLSKIQGGINNLGLDEIRRRSLDLINDVFWASYNKSCVEALSGYPQAASAMLETEMATPGRREKVLGVAHFVAAINAGAGEEGFSFYSVKGNVKDHLNAAAIYFARAICS